MVEGHCKICGHDGQQKRRDICGPCFKDTQPRDRRDYLRRRKRQLTSIKRMGSVIEKFKALDPHERVSVLMQLGKYGPDSNRRIPAGDEPGVRDDEAAHGAGTSTGASERENL